MFSRATIVDVMSLFISMNTHSTMDAFVLRYGLDDVAIGSSKEKRAMGISKFLIENPQMPGILSDNLIFEVVEDIISKAIVNEYHYLNNEFINYPQLRRLLLKDGFVIEKGMLIRNFETAIDFNTNDTLLDSLLTKHNFTVAKGHYEQASNAFNRGDWAACNSQLRTYVEELLNKIAEKVTGKTFTDSQQAKIALSQSKPPIFYKQLNEWKDNGTGYFETFWSRLHPEGSHPGLSNEDDSVFRLNLVQISTLEVLRRYDRNFS